LVWRRFQLRGKRLRGQVEIIAAPDDLIREPE
jgi:hypothetical protein